MFQFLAVPDGVWVTAQEMTLDFTLFCLHKGCGPSETSCPVDEIKTQREAIRTTVLRWADDEQGMQAVSELCGRTPEMAGSCQRQQVEMSVFFFCRCRGQMWGPLREVYITLQTHRSGEQVWDGCEIIRFFWSPLLLVILWVSKDFFFWSTQGGLSEFKDL